jgi:hypothetical protein
VHLDSPFPPTEESFLSLRGGVCSVCLPSALLDNIVARLPYTLLIGYKPGLPATIAFLSVKKTQRVTA